MKDQKLFLVERKAIPEWGSVSILWQHYYLSNSYETLEANLIKEYGALKRFCNYDRTTEVISISPLEYTIL